MSARRLLSPGRLVLAGLALLVVVFAVLWLYPSSDYIFLPDPAHPVAPLVHVPGAKPGAASGDGGVYFVDVRIRRATLLEKLFPGIRDGSSIVPEEAVKPAGVSDQQLKRANLNAMTASQEVASAIALQAAGYRNLIRQVGVTVLGIDNPALRRAGVRRGDVIVSVAGKPVRSTAALRRIVGSRRPGTVFLVGLRRDGALRSVRARTVRDARTGRTLLGIAAQTAVRIAKLPVAVRFDTGDIGGPSAGLAFALAVLDKLGRDVDDGLRVAATGTIEPDGGVGAIGGIKQKTIGAREANADVFLVPAGENAQAARRYANGLRVVPVQSFRQALRALATLGPNT